MNSKTAPQHAVLIYIRYFFIPDIKKDQSEFLIENISSICNHEFHFFISQKLDRLFISRIQFFDINDPFFYIKTRLFYIKK